MAVVSPLLSARRVRVFHPPRRSLVPGRRPKPIVAVDDLHFDLHPGEALGVVGEADSGKAMLVRALVGLDGVHGGSIRFRGRELVGLAAKDWKALRGEIRLLSPAAAVSGSRRKAVDRVADALREIEPKSAAADRRARALAELAALGLDEALAGRKLRELTVGQQQRVALAQALITGPALVVCDDPLAALDVAVQSELIELLVAQQQARGFAMIYVTEDLALVRRLARRVLVMYRGKVMEQGLAEQLHAAPRHPYTRSLLSTPLGLMAAPSGKTRSVQRRPVPPPMGCVFHPRCPLAEHACVQAVPLLRRVGDEQYAACHFIAGPAES